MYAPSEEFPIADSMRRWHALESLWRIGARQEAQRLADSFIGSRASLASQPTEHLEIARQVTLSCAHIDRDPLAPGGITIKFQCCRDDGQSFLAEFRDLMYLPEEASQNSVRTAC